jgi:hypothetical protein
MATTGPLNPIIEPDIDMKDVARRKRPTYMAEKLPDMELSSQQQFLNMLPAFMQEKVALLPATLFELSESELKDRLFGDEAPSQVHQLLRQGFWDEYDRCQRHKIHMLDAYRIIHGVCSLGYFTNRFLAEPENMAWLIVAPTDYIKQMKEILQMGTSQFREIVAMPNTNMDGSPNTKLMDIKFKIIQHVDMRLKGAIIQRIDQRNINVNVDGESAAGQAAVADAARPVGELSMVEVDAKLKALEQKSLALSAPVRLDVDLMKTPTVMLDADEETEGIQKPDVARYSKLPE